LSGSTAPGQAQPCSAASRRSIDHWGVAVGTDLGIMGSSHRAMAGPVHARSSALGNFGPRTSPPGHRAHTSTSVCTPWGARLGAHTPTSVRTPWGARLGVHTSTLVRTPWGARLGAHTSTSVRTPWRGRTTLGAPACRPAGLDRSACRPRPAGLAASACRPRGLGLPALRPRPAGLEASACSFRASADSGHTPTRATLRSQTWFHGREGASNHKSQT